jgi:phosphoglycerate dehydrogenase-like enzyme
VASPHIAASTKEAQEVAGVTTAEQMIKFIKGEKPEFIVNKDVLK